ncbi:MAG TPA: N-6 DNA methylase [Terriglobia bacterium]|nr:N-6 DNA methylase [Terriglobia bacterium]
MTPARSFEEARRAAQAEFDSRVPQKVRNERGQFATPPDLARAMLCLAERYLPDRPIRFLDPALGTGVFYHALLSIYGSERIASAAGFEVDGELAGITARFWGECGLKVEHADFTGAEPGEGLDRADLIVCNPPYVRHHHLQQESKMRLKRAATDVGFKLNGLAGLYAYFLLLADRWLAANGIAVWIIPAEVLDVNYGTEVKRYLLENVTTHVVHRFAPEDVQFDDALVTSVILLFQKQTPCKAHRIAFTSGTDLLKPTFERTILSEQLDAESKWGLIFNNSTAASYHSDGRQSVLSDFFDIKRGLATGANDFFILEQTRALDLGLPQEFLQPILPSQREIASTIIESDTEGFPARLPRFVLLDCPLPREEIEQGYPKLHNYLKRGEAQHLPQRYLPSSRRPWYRQEYRPPAPILCSYMARKKGDGTIFRFFRNHSKATAANVWLLLYPNAALKAALRTSPDLLDTVFQYLQCATGVELVGRVYGGGLNKIEPRELGNLPLPDDIKTLIQQSAMRM